MYFITNKNNKNRAFSLRKNSTSSANNDRFFVCHRRHNRFVHIFLIIIVQNTTRLPEPCLYHVPTTIVHTSSKQKKTTECRSGDKHALRVCVCVCVAVCVLCCDDNNVSVLPALTINFVCNRNKKKTGTIPSVRQGAS